MARQLRFHEQQQAHGTVAEGDQLHALLAEMGEILSSPAYQLTLADLMQAGFQTLSTELHLIIEREGAQPEGASGASHAISRAKLPAQLHNLSIAMLSSASPFAEALLATPALDEFCWMAYSGE